MRVANPYSDLSSLLDTTRQLTPEEMAELQLEQGFVDRALRIYDFLVEEEPHNGTYAMRREWLARLVASRPIRAVGTPSRRIIEEEEPSVDSTLRGMAAVARDPSPQAAITEGESVEEASIVRPLPIVRVR